LRANAGIGARAGGASALLPDLCTAQSASAAAPHSGQAAGPLAGQEHEPAFCSGMRLAAIDGMCLDLPDTPENAAGFC